MEVVFLIVMFTLILTGGGMYLSDRSGWNTTVARITNITRANLESKKATKAIERVKTTGDKDKWTAEFEGKQLETGPKHVIVKTWFSMYGGTMSPFFKCKCGYKDWHVSVDAATRISKDHVREQNRAEELMAKNNGTHAW